MDIWEYVAILKKSSWLGFFSNKKLHEEKLAALAHIVETGFPYVITGLTNYLKDNDEEIRQVTCKTIIHLFRKINVKYDYYASLKDCSISKSDIDFYETHFPKEDFIELLGVCTINRDGHVREKAVRKLSVIGAPQAIRFLIYRLADWVKPVRDAALTGLEQYKTARYIDSWIEQIPNLKWLLNVHRTDLGKVYKDLFDFIVVNNREFILQKFPDYSDKIRIELAKHIASLTFDSEAKIVFLADQHFFIRSLALHHLDQLSDAEIKTVLHDRSAVVRLQLLYQLRNNADFEQLIWDYLADSSAAIRNFARFTLKDKVPELADIYYQNLIKNKHIEGSLAGLGEIDAKQYAGTVKKYLTYAGTKIRKIAFMGLRKLDKEAAYQFALENLDSPYAGLRMAVIDFLARTAEIEVLEKARQCFRTGDFGLKRSMLYFFNKNGGWTGIPEIISGTIDDDERIRQLSYDYLQGWKTKAARLFTEPKEYDIRRARKNFDLAFEEHENKKYFEANQLAGMEKYFRIQKNSQTE